MEVFGFGWPDASGVVVVESPVVEPADPFQGGELEVVETPPAAAAPDPQRQSSVLGVWWSQLVTGSGP